MTYETVNVRAQGHFRFLTLNRPEARNAINSQLVSDLTTALGHCETSATVVVLEGLPDVFCTGADFAEVEEVSNAQADARAETEALYDLWRSLANGSFVSIAHVRGETRAGGMGFVAAADIVIADEGANFALPEMLFGLMPACVFPFLSRRIGSQAASYLTFTTSTISADEARQIGLVDVVSRDSRDSVRRHLIKLQVLRKEKIAQFKAFRTELGNPLNEARNAALAANLAMFSDPASLRAISHFRRTGQILREVESHD